MTAIKDLIRMSGLIFLLACSPSSRENSLSEGCFIIGGCESTPYDTSRVYLRTSYSISGGLLHYAKTIVEDRSLVGSLEIKLPEVFSICGSVKYSESPVYSSIEFINRSRDTFAPSNIVETDKDGRFCTILEVGEYTVLVSPYNRGTIPQLRAEIRVDTDISDFEIIYPPQDKIRFIYGNIIMDPKSGLPVQGINVLAYRNYEDGVSLQSNVSTTDESGIFHLVVPTMREDFSILLSGSLDNPDWPVVWFEDIIPENAVQIGTIDLSFIPPLRHNDGLVLSEESVRIIARAESENAIYTKSFSTDSSGYFEVDLREGRYNFLLVPQDPFISKWGITVHKDIYIPSSSDRQFKMEPKVMLSGRINISKTDNIPRIKIARVGGCNGGLDNIQLENTLIPSRDGWFKDKISKGIYRIIIETENMNRAPLISDYFCIDGDTDLGELILPESDILTGVVVPPDGLSIGDIRIETFIYHRMRDEFVKIGETTATDNKFSIKIPIIRSDKSDKE